MALPRALTPNNIINAFKKTGIFPLDEHVFTDDAFLPSSVSDRPVPSNFLIEQIESIAGSSGLASTIESSPITLAGDGVPKRFKSPAEIRGYPKAEHQPGCRKRRQQGSSKILTDTPEKEKLLEKKRKQEEKERKMEDKKTLKKSPVVKKNLFINKESFKSGRDMQDTDKNYDDTPPLPDADTLLQIDREPHEGNYVVVEFKDKKSKMHYIGKILKTVNETCDDDEEEEKEYEIKFMRCSKKSTEKFIFPQEDDIAVVKQSDILLVLPDPQHCDKRTDRQRSFMEFPVKFNNYNIR